MKIEWRGERVKAGKLLLMLWAVLLLIGGACAEEMCEHADTVQTIVETNACQGYEIVETVCAECGAVLSQDRNEIPQAHTFSDWEMESEATCQNGEIWKRECVSCGYTETESRGEPTDHVFGEMILEQEPDCTSEGLGVRACVHCGLRQEITVAPLGHLPVENVTREPTPEKDGEIEITCQRCGEIIGTKAVPYTNILYNSTITSLGPCTRDLIGGNDWFRLTPLNLSLEGTFTYPLIAVNRYNVGTMTVSVSQNELTVTYQFDTRTARVNSETLIIYENLEEVKNPQGLRFFEVNQPIPIRENLGRDGNVILSLILRADFDAASAGVSYFWEDPAQIQMMTDEITGGQ